MKLNTEYFQVENVPLKCHLLILYIFVVMPLVVLDHTIPPSNGS